MPKNLAQELQKQYATPWSTYDHGDPMTGAVSPSALSILNSDSSQNKVGQFGFHRQPKGSLLEALEERARTNIAPLVSKIQGEGFGLDYPELQEYQGNLSDLREAGQDALFQALDAVTPLPVGIGWIERAPKEALKDIKKYLIGESAKGRQVTKKEIYDKFKTYLSKEGFYKRQWTDKGSKTTQDAVKTMNMYRHGGQDLEMSLPKAFEHTELYRMRPDIASKVKIRFTDNYDGREISNAAFLAEVEKDSGKMLSGTIMVNPSAIKRSTAEGPFSAEENLRSYIIHEIQHAIQAADKMSGGASDKLFENTKASLHNALSKKRDLVKSLGMVQKGTPAYENISNELQAIENHLRFMKSVKNVDDNLLYFANAGEIDAYHVQGARDDLYPKISTLEAPDPRSAKGGLVDPAHINITQPGRNPYIQSITDDIPEFPAYGTKSYSEK